jgi:hypothetical protein
VQSETLGKLAEALAKAQSEMGPVTKEGLNPFFKSKYTKLCDVVEAITGPLSRNSIAILQPLRTEGEDYFIDTTLIHTSGEWLTSRMKLIPGKRDMQGLMAAATYAKRCSLVALLCLGETDESPAPKDDDGASTDLTERQPRMNALFKKAHWNRQKLDHAVSRISNGRSQKASQLSDQEFDILCLEIESEIKAKEIK